ncbi:Ig-like domain-containing protein [Dyadobacter sp. 676]|uniref:Ig-like domain-containing protein n=1 Tax=Dyadobacter sp. 676 TaxID=3088362 RepID=A0AAU8FFR0_9BACT
MAAISSVMALPFDALAQQPTFDCSQASYVIGNRNIGGANVSDGYTLDLSTGETALAKSPLISSGTQFVNAIGYNTVDNYIWGYRSGTNQLVRIGSDWSVEFFTVTGLTGTTYATGDVSPEGVLYLYTFNASSFTKIDLNPGSANYLVAQNVPTTGTQLNDWAFNPVDGKLYGFGTNKTLYQFDPVSGTRTTIGAVTGGGIEGVTGSFGTAFFDSEGHMFVGNNDSGAIFKFTAPLTDLTASLFSNVGIAPGDGARCANAAVPVPPQTVNDTAAVACESTVIDVLANDLAGDAAIVPSSVRLIEPGTLARVTSLSVPGQGSYQVDPVTGAVTFTPVEGFVGSASLSYVVADADGLEGQASLVITGNCPAQPAFPCSELSYVIGNRNIGGSNISDGYTLDLSSGGTVLGKQTLIEGPNAFVNAIGYNTVDNYIWGFRYNTNQLVRIGSDWSTKFYDVTGFPSPVPGYATGDVGPDGVLYLYAANANQITKVDLNPGSANYLTAVTVPTTPTELNDWSFNPTDGQIYAFGTNKVLYSFDPATGARTTLGAVTGAGIETSAYTGAFGTAFFDTDGDMYVGNNGSGAIFKITAPLTNLTASLFSTATGVTPGDGARCPSAIVNDPPVAVDDDGTTTCNATTVDVLTNDVAGSAPLVASSVRLITPGSLDRVTTLVVDGQGQYNVDPTTGAVTFTPLNGLRDTVSIDYVVTDGNGLESIATVTIVVDCPMPVKLVTFDAHKENGTALLSWSTTEEVNSDRFEIERSTTGKNWTQIGIVASNGESNSLKTYQFTDQAPLEGDNLYRLKMVDKDQTFAYSRVRSLNVENGPVAYVYPNPATERVFLNTGKKVVTQVTIVNASGATIAAKVRAGYVDVNVLPAGIYILKVTYQDGSESCFKFLRGK